MDDPWANAWGEPSQAEQADVAKGSSWSALRSSVTADDDKEVDIAAPSWPADADVQWDLPSNEDSLWTQPAESKTSWEPDPSPYEHLPIGRSSVSEIDLPATSPPILESTNSRPTSPHLSSSSTPPTLPPEAEPPDDEVTNTIPLPQKPLDEEPFEDTNATILRHTDPDVPALSPPGSPDGFGTFESAGEKRSIDPWTPAAATFAQDSIEEDSWGSAWRAPQETESGESEDVKSESQPDEWERARKQKELRDQRVPPEVLASILSQTQEFVDGLWPDENQTDSEEAEWSKNVRTGLDIVEGLLPLANRVVPHNLYLSPPVQFKATSVAKGMVEALRMTRNTEIMSRSPMTLYLGAKGSTAWEASLKSKPIAVREEIPTGWRILEKDKDPVSPTTSDINKGKKVSGGLLSFWSKKQAAGPAVEAKAEVRKPSPAPSTERPATNGSEPADSRRSSLNLRPASVHSVTSPTNVIPPLSIPSTSSIPSLTDSAVSPQAESSKPTTPPPSVVSRFLNRFSRVKPGQGSSNRDSLALSSDDLEFLSDIVPTVGDDMEDEDFQLKALSSMIKSSPLPDKLPPPLAPPPKAPLAPPAIKVASLKSAPPPSSNGLDSLFTSTSPQEPSSSNFDDFDSFFDAPKLSGSETKPVATSQIDDDFDSFFGSSPPSGPLPTLSRPPSAPSPLSGIPPPSDGAFRPHITGLANNASLNPPTSPALPLTPPLSTPPMPVGKSPGSFIFPRPPGSRPETPVRATAPRAIMSNTTSQAPATFSFPAPPASSRSQTPLIPPPPRQGNLSSSNTNPTVLQPPPTSQSSAPEPSTPVSAVTSPTNLFGDDEFADFSPIPLTKNSTHNLYDAIFTSSTSSNRGLFQSSENNNSRSGNLSFDDFDDFVSSTQPATLRTPSPPRPPAKTTPAPLSSHSSVPSVAVSNTPPVRGNIKGLTLHQRRASQAIEHQRTRSLVESAAQRMGQWPAPPTPLPNAIPPPTGFRNENGGVEDLLGDDSGSKMGQEQGKATVALSSSVSSPASAGAVKTGGGGFGGFAFPPPPGAFRFPAPPGSERSISPPSVKAQSPVGPPIPTPPTSASLAALSPTSATLSSVSAKGGLSASDLSFFEGL